MSQETTDKLTKELSVLLADVVTLYFLAHGYHWNVEGPDFSQYHGLFAEIYEDVYGSIDPIAEDIRKLDAYAPFTLSKFSSLRTLEPTTIKATTPAAMAASLLKANEVVTEQINKTFRLAIAANEQGIANFLSERDDMHKKWSWQLRASTKKG